MTGGVSIRFRSEAADAALARLGDRAADARGLYDGIGAALVASTQRRFLDQAGPDGNPWPMSIRARLEGGWTLRDRGLLFARITHEADDGGVSVGTDVVYAAIHQFGGTVTAKSAKTLHFRLAGGLGWRRRQSVTIPARPFLGIDDDDRSAIEAQVGDWLAAADAPGGPA